MKKFILSIVVLLGMTSLTMAAQEHHQPMHKPVHHPKHHRHHHPKHRPMHHAPVHH